MSDHENREPPAEYRYAVGAGLGLLVGVVVGLFTDNFVPAAVLGLAVGIVVAYFVKFLRP